MPLLLSKISTVVSLDNSPLDQSKVYTYKLSLHEHVVIEPVQFSRVIDKINNGFRSLGSHLTVFSIITFLMFLCILGKYINSRIKAHLTQAAQALPVYSGLPVQALTARPAPVFFPLRIWSSPKPYPCHGSGIRQPVYSPTCSG